MISHEHKFIFIHIPKTGGTSVETAIGKIGRVTEGAGTLNRLDFKHITLIELYNKFKVDHKEKDLNKYFKFTFVRNPFDWLVSNYFFNRGIHHPYFRESTKYKANNIGGIRRELKDMSFKDWVIWYTNNMRGTQLELIKNENGETPFDLIGRFENLQEDFNIICDKIGIPQKQLPHKKKSQHKHYTEYYDDETREMVVKKYAEDIERFGYKFGE